MRHVVRTTLAIAVTLSLGLSAACGSSRNPLTATTATAAAGTVTVGSANFPENALLAEIYSQAMEAKGVTVSRKFNIGSREVIYSQIQSGALSVLPEYNGALLAYLKENSTASTTADVDTQLAAILPAALKILSPAPAEDKDSLVVTTDTASKYHAKSIADLAPIAGTLMLGGPPEFKTRQQGAIGLTRLYGLTFKGFTSLDVAGPITVSALKKGDVQAANLFSTDPAIVANNFVVLADPKNLFGAQNVIPLVNAAAMTPTGQQALEAVSQKLDTPTLAALVKRVVVDKDDEDAVAKDWLKSVGLVG